MNKISIHVDSMDDINVLEAYIHTYTNTRVVCRGLVTRLKTIMNIF